jgi:hypothetical protein
MFAHAMTIGAGLSEIRLHLQGKGAIRIYSTDQEVHNVFRKGGGAEYAGSLEDRS